MERFRTKFNVWRVLKLVLILVFLEVNNFIGNGGVVESCAKKKPELGGYGTNCTRSPDCRQGFDCDGTRCICWSPDTSRLTLIYNEKLDKCVSIVGKICTLQGDSRETLNSGLASMDCVPNAECVRPKGSKAPGIWGVCQCLPNWEESKTHECMPPKGLTDPMTKVVQKRVGMVDEADDLSDKSQQVLQNTFGEKEDKGTNGNKHFEESERLHPKDKKTVLDNWDGSSGVGQASSSQSDGSNGERLTKIWNLLLMVFGVFLFN